MQKMYRQCETCFFNCSDLRESPCEKCEQTDPEFQLEPPTEYIYEDMEGIWK